MIENINSIITDSTFKVILSNKSDKNYKYNKIVIELKDNKFLASKYTETQVFHDFDIDLIGYVAEYAKDYKQINSFDNEYEYTLRKTKKDKILIGKNRIRNDIKIASSGHNREKNYILKEGMMIEPLIDMGIFTKDGKVVKSMYDKYKQINRYIEIIDDYLCKENYETLNIIDFGCGKSYLTFVLYYYFVKIRNIKVKMVGLDLKKEVINNCNEISKKYGYTDLSFELGDINGYKTKFDVDMVVTLHACDTATDYALYNAIKWNTKMIFSVPCCQHELNNQIESDELNIITRYGIVKERVAALYTDIIRCNLLATQDYKVQLLEFIDFDHTPKNILIRANKTRIPNMVKEKMLNEVNELIKTFNLNPTLYNLLKRDNLI